MLSECSLRALNEQTLAFLERHIMEKLPLKKLFDERWDTEFVEES